MKVMVVNLLIFLLLLISNLKGLASLKNSEGYRYMRMRENLNKIYTSVLFNCLGFGNFKI